MELKVGKYYLIDGVAHWFGGENKQRIAHITEKWINPTIEIQTELNFPVFPSDFELNDFDFNGIDNMAYFLNDKSIIEHDYIIEEADPEDGYYYYEDEETGYLHLAGKKDDAEEGISFIR